MVVGLDNKNVKSLKNLNIPQKDLDAMNELFKKQNKYLPNALLELKTKSRKISHWSWWAFPTQKPGISEPGNKTYLTDKTIKLYLEKYNKYWKQLLIRIYYLMVFKEKSLKSIFPKIDMDRISYFIEFFRKHVYGDKKFSWLQIILNKMLNNKQEIVLMVGYPGSGKTTYTQNNKLWHDPNKDWVILHGDELKTESNIIKMLLKNIKLGKSIVIDATHPSIKKRKVFIDIANSFGIGIKIIHIQTSFEESLKRNDQRTIKVPKIVFYMYRKKFEKPTKNEFIF